jgi:hypothetical protein
MVMESRPEQDPGRAPTRDEIARVVERAFDRSYRL